MEQHILLFEDFHNLNEAKKFQNTKDFEKWLIEIDSMPESKIKSIMGSKYIDTPGFYEKEKDQYNDIIDYMTSNMGKKEFDRLEKYWVENIKEGYIEDITEASGKVSKSLVKVTNKYHDAQLKLQEIQKKFIVTDKEDIAKREKLKRELIAANKDVIAAEKEFQATLGAEDIDDIEI